MDGRIFLKFQREFSCFFILASIICFAAPTCNSLVGFLPYMTSVNFCSANPKRNRARRFLGHYESKCSACQSCNSEGINCK
ncbi:hypothetical protein K456DRAFT_455235 [Colletotrichum gloeosporioides 23]|nr:hypothetical protein K456DRAFT_455235 [Colletotrichum gloeosporioides 23]